MKINKNNQLIINEMHKIDHKLTNNYDQQYKHKRILFLLLEDFVPNYIISYKFEL